MKDEILSYWEMCARQGRSLQRGMYFREPPGRGVILMSRRKNAPYEDEMNMDESLLVYEGHDLEKSANLQDPKIKDQPRSEAGRPTDNGKFADWADKSRNNEVPEAVFRVYEKLRTGTWTDRGLYMLKDYAFQQSGPRRVFKFRLEQAAFDSANRFENESVATAQNRQIPSWVKQEVFKRDHGKCVMCGETTELHFDHDLPFSRGGTSFSPANVRILCARHNLAKSNRVE